MTLTYRQIEGARLAETSTLHVIEDAVSYVVSSGHIGLISGPVGVGKSTSLRAALRTCPVSPVWLPIPPAYSPRDLVGWLHSRVVGPDLSGLYQRDLQDDLVTELTANPRPIVIANAERLTKEAAGQLEWIHSLSPGWPLFLVGITGTRERIWTEPHLRAQISCDIEVRPLSKDEVLRVLPGIHDIFFTASRQLILELDCHFEGNLGSWMRFLHSCLAIIRLARSRGLQVHDLDSELAKAALHQLMPRVTASKVR